ncbi:DUF5060 domain-containing protein [uncultured Eudoraea sp.]|uniref:DUF5060 domain-containing protein n=1 Tax=uncultured Eudoraea sp. TaxID=1035614 RepID=UPI00261EAC61|nr:DUF5060 domain-containing protein [uncultured Eudoraea sp.]
MKKNIYLIYCLVALTSFRLAFSQKEYRQYQPIIMDFEIEATSETASENPFTDYCLQVEFTLKDNVFSVPGFYAADGNAAETSSSSGGTWRVVFTPNTAGLLEYKVSFKKGKNIAMDEDIYSGEPIRRHDGKRGSIKVVLPHEEATGFNARGRLCYANSRYLHTENGEPLLKFGANSPENFLAYADIDSTYAYDPEKSFIKTWKPHVKDWRTGDPVWQGTKGKGIIGALNYLASKGMNSVYALTLNIEGDARDVWPFLSHRKSDFKRYDVSKLAQWDIIFSHAEDLGIIMNLVTQEKENELILDDGYTRDERKLYYRELIARFGYHKNIIWNMGEENGSAPWWPNGQNDQQRYAMIRYIKDHDPYKNPVVIHTMPDSESRNPILNKLLHFDKLDGLSMQVSNIENIHNDIMDWIQKSKEAERPWIVMMDEIGPWHTGTKTDEDDPAHTALRQDALWGTLMAGGAGIEWYFGWLKPPHDLNAEDWRSRNNIWEQSAIAFKFFKKLSYKEMAVLDHKIRNATNYCFGKEGEIYALYLKNGGTESINLEGFKGKFEILWYNPRKGGDYIEGSIEEVDGGTWIQIGSPPSETNKDWTALVRKVK